MISAEFEQISTQYELSHSIKQIEPTERKCLEHLYFQNENVWYDKNEHFYQKTLLKFFFQMKGFQKENEEISTL